MTLEIWVVKATFEKNASDGISYHRSLSELAERVLEIEENDGHAQVYRCVPVEHHAYRTTAAIDIEDAT